MSRLTRLLTVAVLLFTLPLFAEDKKKSEQKPETKAGSEYVAVGEYDAIITRAPGGKNANNIAIRGTKVWLELTARGKARLKSAEEDPVLELTSDVKVRLMQLPPKKDEKGRTVPYTEKEKKEAKGDSNLRGYKAELEDLRPGHIVTLHLMRLKGAKGEDAEKRFVDRIYIKGDAPALAAPPDGGERKKEK